MTPQQLFAAGELVQAIAGQNAAVRSRPTDLDARWLLFVLLCWAGELDRAVLQLDALAQQNAEFGMGVSIYRSLLLAEAERHAVLTRTGNPLLPPDSPPHVETRLEALRAVRAGESAEARALLERAEGERREVEGKLDGETFADLVDSDDLLGPVLEVFAGGHYLWLPIERIRTLEPRPAKHKLELLWLPAELEDASGERASIHLPALYFGSASATDPALRVGNMTAWNEIDGVLLRGSGQKVLISRTLSGDREVALRDVRSIEIAATPPGAG
jgi:type VI secretion system protein ImpE